MWWFSPLLDLLGDSYDRFVVIGVGEIHRRGDYNLYSRSPLSETLDANNQPEHHFVSGRFTGRSTIFCTLVLPSMNRNCFVLFSFTVDSCRGDSHVGGVFVTLVLPLMNQIYSILCAHFKVTIFSAFYVGRFYDHFRTMLDT